MACKWLTSNARLSRNELALLILVLCGMAVVNLIASIYYAKQHMHDYSHPITKVSTQPLDRFYAMRWMIFKCIGAPLLPGTEGAPGNNDTTLAFLWTQPMYPYQLELVAYPREFPKWGVCAVGNPNTLRRRCINKDTLDSEYWCTCTKDMKWTTPNESSWLRQRVMHWIDTSVPLSFVRESDGAVRRIIGNLSGGSECRGTYKGFGCNTSALCTDASTWNGCGTGAGFAETIETMQSQRKPVARLCHRTKWQQKTFQWLSTACEPLVNVFILPYIDPEDPLAVNLEGSSVTPPATASTWGQCVANDPPGFGAVYFDFECLSNIYPAGTIVPQQLDDSLVTRLEVSSTRHVDGRSGSQHVVLQASSVVQGRADTPGYRGMTMSVNFDEQVIEKVSASTWMNVLSSTLSIFNFTVTVFGLLFTQSLVVKLHFAYGKERHLFDWERRGTLSGA